MSSLGQVWNRALGRYINVELSTSGPGWARLSGAISQKYKDAALAKVKAAFEDEKLFKEADMKQMDKLVVT